MQQGRGLQRLTRWFARTLPPGARMSADRDRAIAICFWNADLARGQSSRRFAVIVPQQSTQSFAANDFAGCPAYLFPRYDQEVADLLMIALHMKMLKETDRGCLQRSLAKEDHAQAQLNGTGLIL